MKFFQSKIKDVFVIEPNLFGDDRGYFLESFNKQNLEKIVGFEINFVQDNESRSSRGVLRGFAFQKGCYAQAKLVRVTEGEVLDVVLDMREESSTFGQYVTHILSARNKKQVFIPRGCAHAFVTLSDTATFQYKVDNYFSPENEEGVLFSDDMLNIDWKLNLSELIVSEKDLNRPKFEQAKYFKKEI